jgi:hypothetical protein
LNQKRRKDYEALKKIDLTFIKIYDIIKMLVGQRKIESEGENIM